MESNRLNQVAVIIPASGVGSRMRSSIPKQYLPLHEVPILEHTISKFIDLPFVEKVIIAISKDDTWFSQLKYAKYPNVLVVEGGKERADSVLNALKIADELEYQWVMVHDAARPCVKQSDIKRLYERVKEINGAAILGCRVKDTMKRTLNGQRTIKDTVSRTDLWHAFTPQCVATQSLLSALTQQITSDGQVGQSITDEASALELAGIEVEIVESCNSNIKVTNPSDIALAEFYLESEKNEH